jgi:spore germination cell wall hydrolase CwlJ-like protein
MFIANKLRTTAVILLTSSLTFSTLSHADVTQEDTIERVVKKEVNSKDLSCLTRAIYYEASGEPRAGKIAVANVVINRLKDPRYPKTVCEVVYQRAVVNGVLIYQFSWAAFKELFQPNNKVWQESQDIALQVLTEGQPDDIIRRTNAMFFHSIDVNPGWRLKKVIQIGRHIFYSHI